MVVVVTAHLAERFNSGNLRPKSVCFRKKEKRVWEIFHIRKRQSRASTRHGSYVGWWRLLIDFMRPPLGQDTIEACEDSNASVRHRRGNTIYARVRVYVCVVG